MIKIISNNLAGLCQENRIPHPNLSPCKKSLKVFPLGADLGEV